MTYSAHCDHANTWRRHSSPVGQLLSCTDTNFTGKLISVSQQNSCGSSSGHAEGFKLPENEQVGKMNSAILCVMKSIQLYVRERQGTLSCWGGGANAIGKWRYRKWMCLIHNGVLMGSVCQGPKVSQQILVTGWSMLPPVSGLNAVGVYVELFVRQQDFDF